MSCRRGGPAGSPGRRSASQGRRRSFVDDNVAPYAHRIRPAEVDRLVADAIGRFMPAEAERQRRQAADGRYFAIEHTQVSFDGTSRIHGELDLADALDLETRVAHEAAVLAACGSDETLDVRRSQALGQIARHQTSLDLQAPDTDDRPAARQTVVHVHLSPDGPFARVEARGRRLVTVDQVREWLHTPLTQVVIKPVIDLNDHLHVDQYEVPDRLADQAAERDLTCVFPWCSRPAKDCDDDHVIPYSSGRSHRVRQPRAALPQTPPAQDPPLRLGLHRARTRVLPVVLTAWLPVPPRPPRHHRRLPRPRHLTGHPTPEPTAPHPAQPRQSGGAGTLVPSRRCGTAVRRSARGRRPDGPRELPLPHARASAPRAPSPHATHRRSPATTGHRRRGRLPA